MCRIGRQESSTYLIALILLVHSALTFSLCDDLTGVFHDDLVRLEASVASNSITAICGLDDLHANAEATALLGPRIQPLESAVLTVLLANVAIRIVALVEHYAVLAVLSTPILGLANTLRLIVLEVISLSPVCSSISDKSICKGTR